jgi:hypothetical protein
LFVVATAKKNSSSIQLLARSRNLQTETGVRVCVSIDFCFFFGVKVVHAGGAIFSLVWFLRCVFRVSLTDRLLSCRGIGFLVSFSLSSSSSSSSRGLL